MAGSKGSQRTTAKPTTGSRSAAEQESIAVAMLESLLYLRTVTRIYRAELCWKCVANAAALRDHVRTHAPDAGPITLISRRAALRLSVEG